MYATTQPVKVSSDTSSRLQGYWLTTSQITWVFFTAIALFLFVAAIPLYLDELRMPATNIQAGFGNTQLFTEDMALLNHLSILVDAYAAFVLGSKILIAVVSVSVGLFIFWRKPNDRMALLASLMMVLLGSGYSHFTPIQFALVESNSLWYVPVYLIMSVYRIIGVWLVIVVPNGQFLPRWTRWAVVFTALVHIPATFLPNSPLNVQNWSPAAFLALLTLLGTITMSTAIYRYWRYANAVERQQTKWFILGFFATALITIFLPALIVILTPTVQLPGLPHLLFTIVNQLLFTIGGLVMPLTIAFSVLRYRLWDVDLVINRSLVYGAVTAILGLVFFASVFILQQIFQLITGGMQSPFALAISTLIIGSLFQPTQRRLRRFINRRFYHLVVDVDKADDTREITNPGSLSGTTLGQYEVLEPIGRGGMGEVYRGFHPGLERSVAIKVLPQLFASEQEFIKRFEREARAVAGLRHPNIVNVFDFGYRDNISYMVMEYINGQELSMILRQGGKLPVDMVVSVLSDIASALDYAHQQGLVHRDIKPSNIMLEQNEARFPRAILMDFGIARLVNSATRITGTGMLGTLDYVAPEQIIAAREVDQRADIYSLGVTAYQMLTGTLPYRDGDVSSVIFGHLYKPAPDSREIRPEVPEHIAEAVRQAMAKSPVDRFQSAGEFAAALT